MRRGRPKLFLKGRSVGARRRLALVFAVVFAPAVERSAHADCVPFDAPPAITNTFDLPSAAVAVDMDRDSDLDALVVSRGEDTIAWYENDGAGSGWTFHVVATGVSESLGVAAGDFDRDGDPDVVAPESDVDDIVWFENLAPGVGSSWTRHLLSTATNSPIKVGVGDFDGDGDLDVACGAFGAPRIAWYRNNGAPAASTWARFTISTSTLPVYALDVADIDGDGQVDPISSGVGETASVLAWDRSFGAASWSRQVISTTADAFAITTGDVDGDGDADVVAGAYSAERILWFENVRPPEGSVFGTWNQHTVSTSGASGVALGDLDGDGDLDLLAARRSDGAVGWFESDGAGLVWTRHEVTAPEPGEVSAADLDRDGDLDLLAVADNAMIVRWLRNERLRGAPLFGAGLAGLSSSFDTPRQITAADFDRDGETDIAFTVQISDAVYWGHVKPNSLSATLVSTRSNGPLSVDAADVDGDGWPDLLVASRDDDEIVWYENLASFAGDAPTWTIHTISTVADVARQVVGADLDGDGDLDAASASRNDDKIAWYENRPPGDGSAWSLHTVTTGANGAFSVAAADLDGDGDLDLASTSFYDDTIRWFESDGSPANGGWSEHLVSNDFLDPRFVVAGDLDRDGALDLVSASSGDDTVMLHRNFFGDGGSWLRTTVSTTATDVYSVRLSDIDQDGDLDVFAANFGADALVWYENDGSGGAWTPHTLAPSGDGPTSAAILDFEPDGDLDVVSLSANDNHLWRFVNRGTLVFAEGQETNEETACWSDAVP